jgi:pimeloyl-ACP methyl ester carboxylesterase
MPFPAPHDRRGRFFQPLRISLVAALLALSVGGCATISRDILYSPNSRVETVAWTGTPPQAITVTTTDTLDLPGYYWPGTPGDEDIILFFHGRNWNAERSANAAQHLAGAGNAVLVASYRGFGDNPGSPSEAGLLRDAAAFIARARALAGPNARVWLVGHSLGAAVALHSAARDQHVSGVIAMSAFVRIAAAAPKVTRAFIPDRWKNLDALKALDIPVVFVQGELDRLVPPGSADALFAAYQGPSSLVVGAASRHNPDMSLLSPWLNRMIDALRSQPADLPTPPAGWVLKGQRP